MIDEVKVYSERNHDDAKIFQVPEMNSMGRCPSSSLDKECPKEVKGCPNRGQLASYRITPFNK